MLIDLHCHTRYSYDNFLEPLDLIRRAQELGLDGVCITEHHSYRASEPVIRIAEEEGFLVLRGVEVSTDKGHLLVYGVKSDQWNIWSRNNYLRLERVIQNVRAIGGICIPAHPFRSYGSESMGDLVFHVQDIGALETHNGLNLEHETQRAIEAAQALRLPTVGGSDCHKKAQVGSCFTEFDRPIRTIEDLVQEIKSGRCRGVNGSE